jgi:hypothetical protein
MKAYRGSRGIAPLILNIGTRWRWVVSIKPLSFPPPHPHPQPSRKNCGKHWWEAEWGRKPIWPFGGTEKFLAPAPIWTRGHPARSVITTVTERSRLLIQIRPRVSRFSNGQKYYKPQHCTRSTPWRSVQTLIGRSLLPKCHQVFTVNAHCNCTCAHEIGHVFRVPIFTKFINAEQHCVHISLSKFYSSRTTKCWNSPLTST